MDTETMSIILSTQFFYTALVTLPERKPAGAGVYTLRCTVNKCLYSSDIRFPSSVGTSVGVGNLDGRMVLSFPQIYIYASICTSLKCLILHCNVSIVAETNAKCKIYF